MLSGVLFGIGRSPALGLAGGKPEYTPYKPVNKFRMIATRNLLTGFMTDKPKGGRGKKAPYETKQMRIPQPLATQVEALCDRYQEFIAAGGDPANPPSFLEKAPAAPELAKQKRAETAGDRHSPQRTPNEPVESKPSKHS